MSEKGKLREDLMRLRSTTRAQKLETSNKEKNGPGLTPGQNELPETASRSVRDF